jgi:hypothetical protein
MWSLLELKWGLTLLRLDVLKLAGSTRQLVRLGGRSTRFYRSMRGSLMELLLLRYARELVMPTLRVVLGLGSI